MAKCDDSIISFKSFLDINSRSPFYSDVCSLPEVYTVFRGLLESGRWQKVEVNFCENLKTYYLNSFALSPKAGQEVEVPKRSGAGRTQAFQDGDEKRGVEENLTDLANITIPLNATTQAFSLQRLQSWFALRPHADAPLTLVRRSEGGSKDCVTNRAG